MRQELPDTLPTHVDLACYIKGPAIVLTPLNIDGQQIPAGFVTDLASVPRIAWSIVPPWGRYIMAALVHDKHYQVQDVTRRQADARFLRVMRWYNVAWWKRSAMWLAVRAFGWLAWRRNANKLADIGEAFDALPPTRDEE